MAHSAMMLRAEFPVNRNRDILLALSHERTRVLLHLGRPAARSRERRHIRAARFRGLGLSGFDSRHQVIAEHCALAEGVKSFHEIPLGSPTLVALGIAASSVNLFAHRLARSLEPRTNSREVLAGFHLETPE